MTTLSGVLEVLTQRGYGKEFRLLETGRVITDPIISKRYRYEDAIEAYQFIYDHPDQTVKTLLDY